MYTYTGIHIFTGIEFPVGIRAIDRFERQNPAFSINVLSVEVIESDRENTSIVFPLRISKVETSDERRTIALFFNSNEGTSHYSLIKPCKYYFLKLNVETCK